ncbi:hypothetical protein [Yersinia kristensenii]|uniref:hypothetical protein n=1 Tax=Yersinia kristensenii TaxID=28152 RepID=UPI001562BF87|nr:hypothetical protein [Yersinia kristensenii]QKJ15433.1 hypothetical protein HRD70_09740 [Yersinia kristensenii]
MEGDVVINYEEDFQSLCSSFDLKLKLTIERDNLPDIDVVSVTSSGHKWASDFFQLYGENDIESHYNNALIHEFEQICQQADRDKTMTGNIDIAIGLHTLGQLFRKQGRIREACKYLAIACAYLELKKDLSMLYNVAMSYTEHKKSEQRVYRARKGGLGRGRKFEPVRQKVIELLDTVEKPELGWLSKELAFKAIDEPLRKFIEEKGIAMKDGELRARVLRWSRERDEIKAVFEKVVAQNK